MANGTLNIFSEIVHTGNFMLPQELVPADTILVDTIVQPDTIEVQKNSVPPKPTLQQIRNWRWQREKKLLIEDSRYIQPKDDLKVVSSVKVESEGLGLPVRDKNFVNTDWLTILLLGIVILFATVRISSSKYISYLFQSLINYSTSYRMFREKNYSVFHSAFRLEVLFYVVFSIFLYQVIHYFHLVLIHKNLTSFLASLVAVFSYFLVKKAIYLFLGLAFKGTEETNEYLFNMDNCNKVLGIVLFPVVALINYYPSDDPAFTVFLGISVVVFFYIFQLQRGFYILLSKQFSIFYLFLYLCTLEFLPLFLIYKVVVL